MAVENKLAVLKWLHKDVRYREPITKDTILPEMKPVGTCTRCNELFWNYMHPKDIKIFYDTGICRGCRDVAHIQQVVAAQCCRICGGVAVFFTSTKSEKEYQECGHCQGCQDALLEMLFGTLVRNVKDEGDVI